MKIGRTIPPAAAPIRLKDVWYGLQGLVSPDGALKAAEDGIREEFGVAHVFLVSSGTAALALTLTVLKSLSPRREVVLPAFTCFSVPAAILNAGLRPVLCDISSSTFDFDHALLQETINEQTLCV